MKLYKHCTLSSLMASSFFSSALVGSFHAVVNPIPLGEDGGLLPFIRRPNEQECRINIVGVTTKYKDRPYTGYRPGYIYYEPLQNMFAYLACASKRVSPGQDMLVPRFSPLCASWITGTAYQPLKE